MDIRLLAAPWPFRVAKRKSRLKHRIRRQSYAYGGSHVCSRQHPARRDEVSTAAPDHGDTGRRGGRLHVRQVSQAPCTLSQPSGSKRHPYFASRAKQRRFASLIGHRGVNVEPASPARGRLPVAASDNYRPDQPRPSTPFPKRAIAEEAHAESPCLLWIARNERHEL